MTSEALAICARRLAPLTLAVVLVAALLVASRPSATAQPGGPPRVGYLSNSEMGGSGGRYLEALRRGLTELNRAEGRDFVIDARWANDNPDRLTALAQELVRVGVRVIVALEPRSMHAALRATRTIPIVARFSDDPVEEHLVESLAHPGGNLTGLTTISFELYSKRLELLKETVPSVVTVAVVLDRAHSGTPVGVRETEAAARRLGLRLRMLETKTLADVELALRAARADRVDAVTAFRNSQLVRDRARLVALVNQARLPAIYDERAFAEAGGLMSFGTNLDDINRRAAAYVDKILRGARPGDLPIEQPTTFELVVNVRTARALGLALPPSLLLRADYRIE